MKRKEEFVPGLCNVLVKNKLYSKEEAKELEKSFTESSQTQFDNFLLDEGLIDKEDLLKALSDYYQTPALDITGYFFQTFLLRKFPKFVMIQNLFIPLEIDQNFMSIVTANPANPDLYTIIGKYVSHDLSFYVSTTQDIINGIQEFYNKSMAEAGEMLYDEYIDDDDIYRMAVSEEEE